MTMTIDQLFAAAQGLSIEEQSELVKRIIAKIDRDDQPRQGLREVVDELGLSESTRIKLADELDYDPSESTTLHPAWQAEIKRRCQVIDEGKEKLISYDEVKKMISDKMEALKKNRG
jgi:putative addiction module component (TIGR02574 family)